MAFHVRPCQGKKLEVNDKDTLPFFISVKLLEIDSAVSYLGQTYLQLPLWQWRAKGKHCQKPHCRNITSKVYFKVFQ